MCAGLDLGADGGGWGFWGDVGGGAGGFAQGVCPGRASCDNLRSMPTLEHNGLVDMFRENPALAPHLIELLFRVDLPPYATVTVVETSLDQLVPVEFRADLVLELRDAGGALVFSIVLEVQRDKDARKKYAWPVYVVVVRAQKECPTIVLVVAPDAEVSAWAAETIDLGLGRGSIDPLVLGPAREHAAVYFQIVYNALREPMRRALEALIMQRQSEGKATFPPFAQQLIDRGFDHGFREGEVNGKRDVLLRLLTRAGIPLAEDERARIEACMDADTLDRWVDNVLGAKTATDVLS